MFAVNLVRTARLALRLAWYDIKVQRRETFLGLLWVVAWPLVQAAALILVFQLLRGGGQQPGVGALLLTYCGVLIWTTASSVLLSALNALKVNRELVTQVRIPVATLVVSDVTAKYLFFLVQLALAVVAWLVVTPHEQWTAVLLTLPVYVAAFYVALLAMAWVASIAGVALPDMSVALPPVMLLLLALSPVFQAGHPDLPGAILVLNQVNPLCLWVASFYATIGAGGFSPGWPWEFLAWSLLAAGVARVLVDAAYWKIVKVI